MMGEMDWTGELFGGFPVGSILEQNARVARNMIRFGLAPVLIRRNEKLPLCTLSARDAKAADVAAQDAAKEAGVVNWERIRHNSMYGCGCGHKHALTEEKFLMRARVKELLADGANLAVSMEHSTRRFALVDVDTDAERVGFLEAVGLDTATPLTVTTPGVYDEAAETWKHKNGGHLYVNLPEGFVPPEHPGKTKWCTCHEYALPACPHAFAVYWGNGYALVPPSVRKEGAYRWTGGAIEAPAKLLEVIAGAERARVAHIAADGAISGLNLDDGDSINTWSARTSWAALLTAEGWAEHGVDACGCATWTRPGATNDKSATAHDPGCAKFDTSMGHGPIHAWSDAVRWGGRETTTKLWFYAHERHGGDIKAAMGELGIEGKRRDDNEDDLFVLGDAIVPAPRSTEAPSGKGDAPSAGDGGATNEKGDSVGGGLAISVTDFWATREVFTHIREWSIAAYVSPWAMLGSVLAYVTALTPPRVTLPDDGSLNLFVGLVGKPGVGKDKSRNAAAKWMKKAIEASQLEQRAIGSGQGIGALFIQKVKEKGEEGQADRFTSRQIRESALFTIPEIDAVYAHAKQQASTLVDTLRSAWMAEPLGGAYKDVQRDIAVPAGVYRLCLIAGIQPGKARTLLEDASGGLPQRFLWMPATDPTLPKLEFGEKVPYPEPWEWKPPVRLRDAADPFTLGGEDEHEEPGVEITMCESALREHHYTSQAKARGEYEGDDISTHDLFGRMRVAAALALLDERTEVTEEDWTLSATVMAVSTYIRGKVIRGIEDEDRKRRAADQEAAAETAVAVEKATAISARDRAASRIMTVLTEIGTDWVPSGKLTTKLSRPARAYFEDATAALLEAGKIEKQEDGKVVRYRAKK